MRQPHTDLTDGSVPRFTVWMRYYGEAEGDVFTTWTSTSAMAFLDGYLGSAVGHPSLPPLMEYGIRGEILP